MTPARGEPLRVTLTAGVFPPATGGPATYVPRMARELVRRGHAVEVVCLGSAGGPQQPYPVSRINRELPVPVRMARTTAAIIAAARNGDVIFANGLELEAALAGAVLRKPVVQKVVGDYAWERARNRGWFAGTILEYQTARKSTGLRALDMLRALPIRQARRVLVPSRFLADLVAGWGVRRERVTVVSNATATTSSRRSDRVATAAPTLLMVNRLVPWKHVDRVIRLLPQLPEARLVVLGDGPLEDDLRALAKAIGVEQRVRLAGRVDADVVSRWMGVADVFLLNSTYEGLPHVVLEAMACGMPIVATAAGGTSEAVEHERTGLLVPSGDDACLLAALRRVLADRDLAARLGGHARRVAEERFGLDEMTTRTESVLRSACPVRGWVGHRRLSVQNGGG